MEFRISDTFTDSLSKLTSQEQKAVKTTAFDLQLNPSAPGLRFHKLNKCKDPNFCSISINMDLRLIAHKTNNSLLLCYVDHHEDAYAWAERRKIETHPTTGAAQLVEVRETIQEVIIQKTIAPPLFAHIPEAELLSYGVPPEWLSDVQKATEENVLDIASHLPQEAAEALLNLAIGQKPPIMPIVDGNGDAFNHPDAQRRFRFMGTRSELELALEYPWEKWTVFLHPAQRELVERKYSGSVRVSGSAGTGKTIVALHRAVHLARLHPQSQVLITTFSPALANALKGKLTRLIELPVSQQGHPQHPPLPHLGQFIDQTAPEVGGRIHVHAIQDLAHDFYVQSYGEPTIATPEQIKTFLMEGVESSLFSPAFLWSEWQDIVDAWQLTTWEDYRNVQRLGRKTRLGPKQRETAWSIFEQVLAKLKAQNLITWSQLFQQVTSQVKKVGSPFRYVVADEAQDLGIAELRFLAALGKQRQDGLFFTGDLGQRIFQQPFSWKTVGVNIQGRSHTLKINYRTSQQIRQQADRLLPNTINDVDGLTDDRRGTVSVFNGPPPLIQQADDPDEEMDIVAQWLKERIKAGIAPDEIGVFVRSPEQLSRARAAVAQAQLKATQLDDRMAALPGTIAVSTMHLAKGLEFKAVAVLACDDDVLPLEERLTSIGDEADLEEVYNTERHLLYVACTRARDELLVIGVNPISEFVEDLM
jgi:superfamily I DNA/RNA helicase/mRNA-degrading endonuclease RelE of RelBE toxin-antitoxin system